MKTNLCQLLALSFLITAFLLLSHFLRNKKKQISPNVLITEIDFVNLQKIIFRLESRIFDAK